MKRFVFVLIISFFPLVILADDTVQQSKTGPIPPKIVTERDAIKAKEKYGEYLLSQTVLNVPGYNWRHGCGPTALGMVVGYYDGLVYNDLIPGEAGTQTVAVNQAIASGGNSASPYPPGSEQHYEDYARPEDYCPNMINDNYITVGRTPHIDNCLADFMDTSKSTRSNYYGWSWSNDVGPAWTDYVNLRNSSYSPSYREYYSFNSTLTWSVLVNEINNSRPMVFLVDTDGNGGTDHFVTVIGYRDTPSQQYGCLDTWYGSTVRWENFQAMANGRPWGIWGGWAFQLAALQGSLQVMITPQGAIDNGAQWRRAGTSPWWNNGETESGISAGQYTVEFKDISGWVKPSNLPVTINGGQTTTVNGNYVQLTYTITASCGPTGTMGPSGSIIKTAGESILFIANSTAGYTVDKWYLDGTVAQIGLNTFTLSNIQSNHTVEVSFMPIPAVVYVNDDNTAGPWEGTLTNPYQYIQDGINVSSDGTKIIVMRGTYLENVSINGKDIEMASVDPNDPNVVAATIIDGRQLGSVVTITDSNLKMNGFTIQNGSGYQGKYGAGVYCASNASTEFSVIITNCIIQNNMLITDETLNEVSGGGIYGDVYTKLVLENNLIKHNGITINSYFEVSSARCFGAGVTILNSNARVKNNLISNNYIKTKESGIPVHGDLLTCEGSGVYLEGGELSQNIIINNNVNLNLYLWSDCGSAMTIGVGGFCENTKIDHNKVINNIVEITNIDFSIENCIIERVSIGGGLYADCSILFNNLIYNNSCYAEGVDYCECPGDVSMRGGDGVSKGAGVFAVDSIMINNTIYANNLSADAGLGWTYDYENEVSIPLLGEAICEGGGVYADGISEITNCIVRDNTHQQTYGGSVSFSNIEGGSTGPGTIDSNPLFADPNNGNFYLLAGSPCIDTGDNSAVTEAVDLNGRPRIFDGDSNGTATVDMGAYEYQPFIIYVDDSATDGDNNGTSWENAFIYLQDALAAAIYGDEIRVAQGVYKPDRSTAYSLGTGDRNASFHLVNGASLIGGYAGFGASNPDQRDVEQYQTILSGDLLANDSGSYDYGGAGWCEDEPNLIDNCYNVVISIQTDNNTILDGFIISGGYASEGWEAYVQETMGAGLYNIESDLIIINCTFQNNIAIDSGSAIYNQNANPQIIECIFENVYQCGYPEVAHGAIDNVNSNSVISGCRFSMNGVYPIYNYGGNPIIKDCVLEYNHGIWIGAIDNSNTNAEIRNCNFIDNSGRISGAIFNWNSATNIKHCIFAGNYSDQEYFDPGTGGTIWEENSNSVITNCTFYGNCGTPVNGYNSEESIISNSIFYKNYNTEDPNNIVNGPVGPYNYNDDPLFADPNNSDLHLKSEYGRWDTTSQTWVYDSVTSPCIDAGDPNDPNWVNELWPHGKRINMGAYGGTPQASKSPSTAGNIADFTLDNCVGLEDFVLFLDEWLTCQILIPEDMDWDGCVNFTDFSIFAQNWSNCLNQDLVGYWQFNETTGNQANDSSVYVNHGTLVNGPVWTGTGELTFDGIDDYVQMPDSSSLTFTNQITISTWIKLTEDSIRFMKIVIQPANATSADPWENYCIDLRRKNPRFILSAGTPGTWNGAYDTTFSSPLTVGAWYHLAGTYDGSTMILYVNGQPTQSKVIALTIGNNELPLYMGSALGTNGFTGLVDEVRIYNRALNETEIQNLYQNH